MTMRKGLMKDYANQIDQMFVGWQINIADLPRLADIGSGRIEIGLLEDTTHLNGNVVPPFQITQAVRDWYFDAVRRDCLSDNFIRQIDIRSVFETTQIDEHTHLQRHVRLDSTVELKDGNGDWTGHHTKNEVGDLWGEGGPWLVSDA